MIYQLVMSNPPFGTEDEILYGQGLKGYAAPRWGFGLTGLVELSLLFHYYYGGFGYYVFEYLSKKSEAFGKANEAYERQKPNRCLKSKRNGGLQAWADRANEKKARILAHLDRFFHPLFC
jgi:hypothetical protein